MPPIFGQLRFVLTYNSCGDENVYTHPVLRIPGSAPASHVGISSISINFDVILIYLDLFLDPWPRSYKQVFFSYFQHHKFYYHTTFQNILNSIL